MKFLSFLFVILLQTAISMSITAAPDSTVDTCRPSFLDIYNYTVGDIFQFRETSSSSAGGTNPTLEVISQYIILDKTVDSNLIKYTISGWKQSSSYSNIGTINSIDADTIRNSEFIDTTLVFIDSTDHFLNLCPKELIPIDHPLINDLGLGNCYTRIKTIENDSTLIKYIGGEKNVFQYVDDTLKPVSDIYYKAVYEDGKGLTSMKFSFFEIQTTITLEGYLHNNDTTGHLDSGEYPDRIETISSSLTTSKKDKFLKLFPNPSGGIISIETDIIDNPVISIYTLSGISVFENRLTSSQLDISFLSPGIYILKIKSANGEIASSKLFVN